MKQIKCYHSFSVSKRSKVRLGEHDLKNKNPDCQKLKNGKDICNKEVQDFEVDKVTYHPDYNSPTTFRNDIAVIKLKGKVVENGKYDNHFC